MTGLLRAEVRKLWTIWSTYVVFVIVVVLDLLFGFGIAFAPGRPARRRGGHSPPRLFPMVRQRVRACSTTPGCWPSSSASS